MNFTKQWQRGRRALNRRPQGRGGIRPAPRPPQPGQRPGVAPSNPAPKPVLPPTDDAGYQTQINSLQRDYNDKNLALGNQEYQTKAAYGFDPQFANNPYTKANLMKQSYDRQFNSSTNNFASRGQLYSGALNQQRANDTFGYGADVNQARNEYNQGLAGIQGERLSALRDLSGGTDQAYADLIARLTKAEPDAQLYPAGGKPGKGPKKPPGGRKGPRAIGGRGYPRRTGRGGIRPVSPYRRQIRRAQGGIQ